MSAWKFRGVVGRQCRFHRIRNSSSLPSTSIADESPKQRWQRDTDIVIGASQELRAGFGSSVVPLTALIRYLTVERTPVAGAKVKPNDPYSVGA
jgi:hypothetical protein